MTSFLCVVSLLLACNSLGFESFGEHYSERDVLISGYDEESYKGAISAVKKAYQLTDIHFQPLGEIEYNTGKLSPGVEYTGMIYSSVKELGTYVGTNVSFHTFLSAVYNPRSKLYTEHLNKIPYHGKNCKAYYGTVCSGLVSYALGLFPIMTSYDFVSSPCMTDIKYQSPNDVHLADVLWKPGHVAIITDVIRDKSGVVVSIEISEAIQSGCRRYYCSKSKFNSIMHSSFNKVLRYNNLRANTYNIEQSNYVSVLDESSVCFKPNNDLCVDKGDRSNYLKGENVVINLLNEFSNIDIYKDGSFYKSIDASNSTDIILPGLDYGSYQAYGKRNGYTSDPTNWIIVDYSISVVSDESLILFSSLNSSPVSIHFCNLSGDRVYPATELLCRTLRFEEISCGIIDLSHSLMKEDCPFFVIGFQTDFGNVFTLPIRYL